MTNIIYSEFIELVENLKKVPDGKAEYKRFITPYPMPKGEWKAFTEGEEMHVKYPETIVCKLVDGKWEIPCMVIYEVETIIV